MRKLLVFGAMVAAASSAPAFAQEVAVTGSVTLVSDYQWRNVTQSNNDATIQGGLEVSSQGLYANVWASGVDFNNPTDTNLEVDLTAGYRFDLSGIATDVGVIYYGYPDSTTDIDFFEVFAKFSKSFDAITLAGSLNWDPDNDTFYTDASVGYTVAPGFVVSGGYGTYLEGYGEYAGWNAGGTWTVGGVDLGIRYHDADISGVDSSMVFSVGKLF